MAQVNPYAARAPARAGEAPGPSMLAVHGRYAVPDVPVTTDPEYVDGAYATQLDPDYESGTTPDPIRTGVQEPPINDPNVRVYNARRFENFHERHSVEHTSESWDVQQHTVAPAQNPLWEQERLPIRPSANRSPLGYLFTRPWHIPRNINDAVGEGAVNHVSMADHRRTYEIYGMAPRDRMGVNTFRLDPQPWDQGLFPVDQDFTPPATGSVQTGSHAYRL